MAPWFGLHALLVLSLLLFRSSSHAQSLHASDPSPFSPPNVTGSGGWEDALAQANAFIQQLNLTEKAALVTGTLTGSCVGNIAPIPSLNFSGLCAQDGPLSIRIAVLASVFPAGLTAAATWDRDLLYRRGVALGEEFRGKGAHVLLGPVAGPLGRHQLGGRNWEGFSPDPYLTGVAMNSSIRGIQSVGVQACAKHLIGNEQETQRSIVTLPDGTKVDAISANFDDRTMHELYLWPFADSVKAGVASVMCSYNRVNQTYSCENPKVMNGLLKTELGFQGYVMSDFFATHSGVKSIQAGLDMDMPGPTDESAIRNGQTYFGDNIPKAVQNGSLSEHQVDEMLRRVMMPYFYLDQDKGYPTVDPSTYYVLAASYGYLQNTIGVPPARDVRADHGSLIREIGAAGTVLLKNVNSTLPLKQPMNLGIFGNDAPDVTAGFGYRGTGGPSFGFDVGTLSVGGGSGSGRASYIVSPLAAIKAHGESYGARVQYLTDNNIIAADNFESIFPTPDVCLVFLKTWAQEGVDRVSYEADYKSTLVVEKVASHCPNTVVITHSAGVNTMPWASNPNVTAILVAHYPGQENGNSITDVLFGKVNPSGRLSYTIPRSEEDCGIPVVNITGKDAANASAWQDNFTEGLMIDYRCFDAKNITPLYEFGYGLSYTTFELTTALSATFTNGNISTAFSSSNKVEPGGNPELWQEVFTLSTIVQNTGSVAGASVVQLYLSLPKDTVPSDTPQKVLRGFQKVYLEPGKSETVHFSVLRRDVSFWNVTAQDWQIPSGEATFNVGFSSLDLRKSTEVQLRAS